MSGSSSGSVFNVKDYGALGTGVDDTVAIEAARAACIAAGGGILFFPDGTFGFDYTASNPTFGLYINTGLQILGVGAVQTILKNLSATAAGIRCASGSPVLRDFSLDQNGSTGIGLQVGGQYSQTTNVEVKNQAGTNYAIVIDGATLAELDNIRVHASTNGISIGPTLPTGYVSMRQVAVEVTTGIALTAVIASRLDIYELHIEDSGAGHGKLLYVNNCQHVNFFGFSCETTDLTMSDPEYFVIENSRSVNFWGGRVNHSGAASKTLFLIKGNASQNVNWDGMDVISTKAGMAIFEVNAIATLYGIHQRRIRTTLTSPATGVAHTTSVIGAAVEEWLDNNAVSGHTLKGTDLFVRNVAGSLTITGGARHTLVQCSGVIAVSGTDDTTRIGSDSGSALRITLPTFADNAAALAGGLVARQLYKVATGELRIVV